jgi:hypothetical protein
MSSPSSAKSVTQSSSWVFATCCVCEIMVRGFFRLRNDQLHGEIYLLEITLLTTDPLFLEY